MKLGIKNFRSLKDTSDIEIKPITILVGKNSSGKSSFIRTFPMLKQSFEEKTKTPILLFGSYVDFGSYKDIKPHNSSDENQYELSFTIEGDVFNELIKQNPLSIRYRYRHRPISMDMTNYDVSYGIKFAEDRKQLIRISEITTKYLNQEINIQLDFEKNLIKSISINNDEAFGSDDKISFVDRGELSVDIFQDSKQGDFTYHKELKELIQLKIQKIIYESVNNRTQPSTILGITANIILGSDNYILQQLKSVQTPKTWHDNVKNWDVDTPSFISLKKYLFLYETFSIVINVINMFLKSTFLKTKYIAPLRATAERYYRIQHLAIDGVDPNGKNLPVFLDSLSDTQMNEYQIWTLQNFGFKTKISKIEGHYSIKIEHENNFEINLSDMGFGYSQILPILTQLWYSSSRFEVRYRSSFQKLTPIIIVIEQPELHLHPEFQAKFADVLAKIIKYTKEAKINFKLIIETHSDIIINRLGDCIISNELDHNDVNIVVFNKTSEHEQTEVSFSNYDKDGNLNNWPFGFFLPIIK